METSSADNRVMKSSSVEIRVMDNFARPFTASREGALGVYRLFSTSVEIQEEVIRHMLAHLKSGVLRLLMDRSECPSADDIHHAKIIGSGLGLLLQANGASLAVIMKNEDIYAKALGFEVLKNGGRVLTTTDAREAELWVQGIVL